jgi:hypothetical protein
MDLLLYVLVYAGIAYVVIVIAITLYLTWWLEPLNHERYNGLHVYAVDLDGTRWHVPRPLLTVYRDIKDPRISTRTGQPPSSPREIKLWTLTLGLPAILSPVIRALRRE